MAGRLRRWGRSHDARKLERADDVRSAIRKIAAKANTIEFVAADLNSSAGWADAVTEADYMLHVASPVPTVDPKYDEELVRPARDGTPRVIKAARDTSMKRVVMTSSISAIINERGVREKPFTEED
jgi:dihydroflavonol-4-reductase